MIDKAHADTRLDNVYRKVENIYQKNKKKIISPRTATTTTQLNSQPTSCSPPPLPLAGNYAKHSVDRRDKHYKLLRTQFKHIQQELKHSNAQATNAQTQLDKTKLQLQTASEKIAELHTTLSTTLEEYHSLLADNEQLMNVIGDMEKELHSQESLINDKETEFSIVTKEGRRYLNSVRTLYYNLMTIGIPPAKIIDVIRAVISKLCLSLDISTLQLPKKSCANYMRMGEMPTVEILTTVREGHINSDGTTLNMRKLVGSAINGTVMAVNEVSDGTSETMLKDSDKVLTRLRDMANKLQIPNANSINWGLIVSSTSDGASTQTKFNRLLQELRERDQNKFGPANESLKELVVNKCGMHLGVNLRKAQNAGILEHDKNTTTDDFEVTQVDSADQASQSSKREYAPIDSFVHAFCKLLGPVGTPEYGQGVKFRDFLSGMLDKSKSSGDTAWAEY